MLSSQQFDLWSGSYDQSVMESDEENSYPFAGYREVMNGIYSRIISSGHGDVLDVGLGTGLLANRLYEAGFSITGMDFSPEMIRIAQEKMPRARLICHDFTQGLPEALDDLTFDFITATYSLHHLAHKEQADFIALLLTHLKPGGVLLMGDVAFEDAAALSACQESSGDEWDDEEYYFCFDNFRRLFPGAAFTRCSHCAGIILLKGSDSHAPV